MKQVTRSVGRLGSISVLGLIVIFGVCSPALSQATKSPISTSAPKPEVLRPVDAEPNSTVANFGDWALRCQRLGNGAEIQRVCEVAQQVRAQDQQNPVAELAIGRLKKTDPLRLTVILPVNITISNPPGFSADGKTLELADFGWRKCLPGGCIADVLLKDDLLRRLKVQATIGRITWTDAAGRDLAIGLSFRGLTQALDALNKEP